MVDLIEVKFVELYSRLKERMPYSYTVLKAIREEMNKTLGSKTPPKAKSRASRQTCASKCIICGDILDGPGNNPSPYCEIGRCCDKCNIEVVIPERMEDLCRESIDAIHEQHDNYNKSISEGLR